MNSAKHLMRSHMACVMLLCIAGGVTACVPVAEQPAPTIEADVAAISRVIDEGATALNAADAAGMVGRYTEDAVSMPPDRPVVIGQEALRARYETTFDQSTFEYTRSVEEVVVAGDWAFGRWTDTGTVTTKAVGEPSEISSKGIFIMQRQPDGFWKITRAIWNNDTPPPDTSQ